MNIKKISMLACSALTFCCSFAFAEVPKEFTIDNYAFEGTMGNKIKVRIVLEKRSDGLISGVLTYLKYNKSFRVIGTVDYGLSEYQANGEVSGSIFIDSKTIKPTEWSSMQKADQEYTFNLKPIDIPSNYISTFQYGDVVGVYNNSYTNPYRGNSNASALTVLADGNFEFTDFSTAPYSDFKTKGKLSGNKAELYVDECVTIDGEESEGMKEHNYKLSSSSSDNSPKFTVEVFKDFAYVNDSSKESKCPEFHNYGLKSLLIRTK